MDALFKAFAAELTPVAAATAGEVFFEDVFTHFCQARSGCCCCHSCCRRMRCLVARLHSTSAQCCASSVLPLLQAYSELQDADLRSSHSGSQQACRDANYLLGVLGRWKKQSEWRAPVLVMLVLFSKRR